MPPFINVIIIVVVDFLLSFVDFVLSLRNLYTYSFISPSFAHLIELNYVVVVASMRILIPWNRKTGHMSQSVTNSYDLHS